MEGFVALWMHRGGRVGILLLALAILVAVFAPLLTPYGPHEQIRGHELMGMSWEHPFGTDLLGRDIYTRTLYGARVSLIAGSLSVLLGAVLGTFMGITAGYLGSWIDAAMMRLADAISAFPAILLGAAVVAVLGPGFMQVAIAIAIAQSPQFARLARAITLVESKQEYVEAAEAMGASRTRVMVKHLLPNAMGPLVVQCSLSVGIAILLETGLSFLGLGVQPPTPSWGQMLADALRFIEIIPAYAVLPGLALTVVLVGVNLIADAMRDKLDPQHVAQKGA
ncbi:MAG: ABC transporter permease [Albidovulum sp.]|nr:ABC transporter permease [Albidovulum sp.]MDE0532740.1 ABC transporter permease [Albidovulum sp.]